MDESASKQSPNEAGGGPVVPAAAYVDPTARVHGKVRFGPECSLWPYAVIRCEALEVRIGRYVNMQDHSLIHIGAACGTVIGDYCSITHRVTVHGGVIGENTLVGINATVMDGAVIGDNCIIGAHCLVPEGMRVPDNSVVVGVPGRIVRTRNNFIANRRNAMIYHWNARAYARGDHRGWEGPGYEVWHAQMMAELQAEFRRRYPEAASQDG